MITVYKAERKQEKYTIANISFYQIIVKIISNQSNIC